MKEKQKKTKNVHFRNEKLKANRASETDEQRRERLRIRREKDRAKRTKKNYNRKKKRSSVTEDNENQRLATLKRLKRGDENELERNVPVSVYRVPVSVYRVPVSRDGGRKKSKKRNELARPVMGTIFLVN